MFPFVARLHNVKGKKINIVKSGQGPDIVLVHGWSSNWEGWIPLAKQLASDYTLHMIDMPGFGDSDPLDEYTIENESFYLAATIRSLNIKPKGIISASLGTIISAQCLAVDPSISDKLILIGAIFNKLSLNRGKQLYKRVLQLSNTSSVTRAFLSEAVKTKYAAYLTEKFINSHKFDRKKVDRYKLKGRKKMDNTCYVRLGLSAFEFMLEDYLRETNTETLILYGTQEKLITKKDATKKFRDLANPKLCLTFIDEAGHSPSFEQPQNSSKVIREFINAGCSKSYV